METPNGHIRAEYNEKINQLITAIKTSQENGRFDIEKDKLQKHLDKLAEQYQYNEYLGKIRHKLYDAQALIYYLVRNDVKAREFISAAEETNGGPTPLSAGIANSIDAHSNARGPGSGVEAGAHTFVNQKIGGWLAVLVVGIVIGIGYNAYSFVSGINVEHTITPEVESAYPGLTALVNVENSVTGIAIICGVALLYLIFRRRKLARYFGIFFFCGLILFSLGDMAVANSMFANNPDALAAINDNSGAYTRILINSLIWGAYLIFSKRAKSTLIK